LLGAEKAKKIERPVIIWGIVKNGLKFAFRSLQIASRQRLTCIAQQGITRTCGLLSER
jgi:hypothetical protein